MPCRDYYDEPALTNGDLAIRNDKLARINCKILEHLEGIDGGLEFLLLKDPEVAEWWREHKEADRKAREEEAERRRKTAEKSALRRRRNEIKAKLTPEELKILGVK